MAGTDFRFNASQFRDAIHTAMSMGLPNATQERATFRWITKHTYDKNDPTSRPYNWTSTPATTTSHPDVQIPVAAEFAIRSASGAGDTVFGKFEQSRVVLTILDVDYVKIDGASVVELGEDDYDIDFTEPPIGLFDVTIYRVHCTARDES